MKNPLRVTLHVKQPSSVELHAQETIRVDRLTASATGQHDVERHGELVRPGVTALHLHPGVYHFRSLTDTALRVVHGGSVTVTANDGVNSGGKDLPPPPQAGFSGRGEAPVGDTPTLTVVRD
jgi:hypothetical protein